jgi:hypothetical protein
MQKQITGSVAVVILMAFALVLFVNLNPTGLKAHAGNSLR